MSRRALAFLVGVVAVIVLFAATELISLPYVVLYPGPALNTLGTSGGRPVIEVAGHQTYPSPGAWTWSRSTPTAGLAAI